MNIIFISFLLTSFNKKRLDMSNKKTNFAKSNVKTNQLNLITYMANIKELYNELVKNWKILNDNL